MSPEVDRRSFLVGASAGALGLVSGACQAPLVGRRRPNILFIHTDQQGADTLSLHAIGRAATPNLDRLASRGVTFRESYCTNPVCSPSRSGMYTGRMASETGVFANDFPMVGKMPDLGQWLHEAGYDVLYSGKWHIPGRNVARSFDVILETTELGELCDGAVSRATEGFLHGRRHASRPFFLSVGLLEPHDISYWIRLLPGLSRELPSPQLGELPDLPPNFDYDPREPETMIRCIRNHPYAIRIRERWNERDWRYYLWSYDRQVEMADAEIGRVLGALDAAGLSDSTLVVFTSDHGDGRARHGLVLKSYLYDEAAKVPLILSWPGEIPEGVVDEEHIVSGVDLLPTLCDYAAVPPPEHVCGRSLRPLFSGADWRDMAVSECLVTGRMVRTPRYKLITYRNDPVEQLFDLSADPWEMRNLIGEASMTPVVEEHRRLLAEWESQLTQQPEPEAPCFLPET